MSKEKNKKRTVPTGRGRVLVLGGDPKMSEVILELANPLLDGDVSNAKEVDFIVQLTIAAWNKAMFSADRQDAVEKEIIDTLVPPDGDAGLVGAVIQAMEIVDDRRKRLFPNLRRFVVDYDLQVSEGRVALNILSESMSADRWHVAGK
jgi:hypothetical protein